LATSRTTPGRAALLRFGPGRYRITDHLEVTLGGWTIVNRVGLTDELSIGDDNTPIAVDLSLTDTTDEAEVLPLIERCRGQRTDRDSGRR